MLLGVSACQENQTPSLIPATTTVRLVETSTPTLLTTPDSGILPAASAAIATVAISTPHSMIDISGLETSVGYSIREPNILPDGYVLEKATIDEPTSSVCLQYRHTTANDSVLFIAQGPINLAPPLALISGWPEYAVSRETVQIGGAENGFRISGWRRNAWACAEAAEKENTPFSYALAPQFTWEADHQQFDVFSASGGCGTPGGLTTLDLFHVAEGLTGNSTHAADELDPECLRSIVDVEKMAGFDVREPAYLPKEVSFYFATFEKAPSPVVILRFYHEQHRDMGTFFQISQQMEASPFYMTTCAESSSDVCEILQIDSTSVVYQYSGSTEQMDWNTDGFYFSLFRNAGEPGKVYKDELVKVIDSLK